MPAAETSNVSAFVQQFLFDVASNVDPLGYYAQGIQQGLDDAFTLAQETAADPAKPKVVNAVTLELTPAESERLDLARSVGSLSLALRNELDRSKLASAGTRLDDLMHEVARSAISAPDAIAPKPNAVVTRPAQSTRPASSGVEEFRGIQRGVGSDL